MELGSKETRKQGSKEARKQGRTDSTKQQSNKLNNNNNNKRNDASKKAKKAKKTWPKRACDAEASCSLLHVSDVKISRRSMVTT